MSDLPPDDGDGYLFLVVDKQFYALTKTRLKEMASPVDPEADPDVSELLTSLVDDGFVLADIQGPGESAGRPDSCACVALNIDKFDARITEKQQKIRAIRAAVLRDRERQAARAKTDAE